MRILKKFTKMVLDVAETPISIIMDVATMGGAITDQDEPYTVSKIKEISKDYKSIKRELTDD